MRWVFFGLVLIVLLVGTLALAVNIQPVRAQETIYIRADGSIDPPTANITTTDHVTYTFTGNINDSIVVERDNIIVEGAGYTLTGYGYAIDLVNRSDVTIRNATIERGIQLESSNNSRLSGNNITDIIQVILSSNNTIQGNNITSGGIRLQRSSNNNTISGNTITWTGGFGIEVELESSHNIIIGNNITDSAIGIELQYDSHYNVVSGNIMNGNEVNFGVSGDYLSHSIDASNLVNGKPVYYLVNQKDLMINPVTYPEIGYLALINCTNATVDNLTLTNKSFPIVKTQHSRIANNNMTNVGVQILESSNITIYGDNILRSGIHVDGSDKITISKNNLENGGDAIVFGGSSNNIVSGNNITNNGNGISLFDGAENITICENNLTDNTGSGLNAVGYDASAHVYHNTFTNNTIQVYVRGYIILDDGYPSGGNCWSDYAGVDEKRGTNQDQPGSDGIGDTPYIIDENNRDPYPLIDPWISPEHDIAVSITTPINLRLGSSTSLVATVTNEGLNDEVNVELPIFINGTAMNSTIISFLQAGNSYTLNYHWTPTIEGTYNVTADAPPVPGEERTDNNQQTAFVNVSAPEIVMSLITPTSLRVGTSSLLNATVSRQIWGDYINVESQLLINGSIVFSELEALLLPGDSYTLSYLWTPAVEGRYNVTAYAIPVRGETSLENNVVTQFVTVTASLPPGMQVGVKAGDWAKYTYTISGYPSGTPYPSWLKVEFLSVEGTNATVQVTMHISDGTEQNATMPVDVVAGGGTFQGLSGFVIPANCTTGDSICMSGYGNVTIAGETTSSYAGATRTVIYASFSQYGTQLTYYWDKLSGAMVEASAVSGGATGTGKATETNMWQAAPSGLPIEPIYLYTLAAFAVIIAIGAAVFITRRKKSSEEVENSQSELRLTRTGFRRNLGHGIAHV